MKFGKVSRYCCMRLPCQANFRRECWAVLFARAVPTFSSAAICGSAMMSAFISLHSSVHRSLGSISLTRLSFFIGNGAGEQPGHTEIWDYNEFQRGRQIQHASVRDRHVVQLWCKLRIRTGSTRHAGHTALASQGPCWGPVKLITDIMLHRAWIPTGWLGRSEDSDGRGNSGP